MWLCGDGRSLKAWDNNMGSCDGIEKGTQSKTPGRQGCGTWTRRGPVDFSSRWEVGGAVMTELKQLPGREWDRNVQNAHTYPWS